MNAIFKTVMTAAFLISSAAISGAVAEEDIQFFEFRVERAALNTETGLRVAYQRLNAEAQRYCAALSLNVIHTRTACRADVVEYVVDSIGHDSLRALHIQRTQDIRTLADRDRN